MCINECHYRDKLDVNLYGCSLLTRKERNYIDLKCSTLQFQQQQNFSGPLFCLFLLVSLFDLIYIVYIINPRIREGAS
jgi:hypothetical protein